MNSSITLSAATETQWDAIVIGAGMGGSAAAFALAKAGRRVLVVERGKADFDNDASVSDHFHDPEARLQIGRWPSQLRGEVDSRKFDFFAPLGAGLGGSTILYAAALDRFRPVDFDERVLPSGATPTHWPYGYDQLAEYYEQAETMLEVSGTPDPLGPDQDMKLATPPELQPRDAYLFDRFANAGLHPYRLHAGCRFLSGCASCLGKACLRDCKRHGGNAFLEPAQQTGNVALLTDTEVLRLAANSGAVTALEVRQAAETATLTGDSFALSAGTYFSPSLLLNSTSEDWPTGIGNHNDQVGRNLMFHTGRSLAVWARRGLAQNASGKSIVFRDLYDNETGKFGEVQSTGAEAAYGNVVYALRQMLSTSRYAKVPLLWHLARIPAFAASRLLGNAAIFELIMEDLPYSDNRITVDPTAPSGIRFEYQIRQELHDRYEAFSNTLSERLNGIRHLWLSHGTALNYGHPMGTCRIGVDQRTSVADADGRVHRMSNLFIVDGSFLPSSGGTNPSLTIAAHALRTGTLMSSQAGL